MAKVTDQVLDHDYDGIKEYDNPLPGWWVWMFIGCVVWGIAYVPYYHFGPGQLPREVYEEDMAAWYEKHPPPKLASAEELEAMAGDEALIAQGQSTFATLCASCHAPDGGGLVGPNLTDDYSIHGYGMEPIAKTIFDGVPDKGMVAWKTQLSMDEIYGVAAYVHSLRGKPAAKPKEPQGDKIED
jgi:cytochrome c oxidase cbb3-type subunit 3